MLARRCTPCVPLLCSGSSGVTSPLLPEACFAAVGAAAVGPAPEGLAHCATDTHPRDSEGG